MIGSTAKGPMMYVMATDQLGDITSPSQERLWKSDDAAGRWVPASQLHPSMDVTQGIGLTVNPAATSQLFVNVINGPFESPDAGVRGSTRA
jgi:hypothetical protein